MSELTRCNFCSLVALATQATERGAALVVTNHQEPDEMAGWTSVRISDRPEPSAYFLAVSDHCVCAVDEDPPPDDREDWETDPDSSAGPGARLADLLT